MELTQTAGLQRDKRRSNRLGDGEVGRVDLVELAAVATNLLWLMVGQTVHVGAVTRGVGVRRVSHVKVAHGAVQDVRRRRGKLLEDRLVNAEVFGDDVLGGVEEPIVDVEGRPVFVSSSLLPRVCDVEHEPDFVKVTIVKHQEILALICNTLDSVCDALRKVPDISIA